MTQLIVAFLVCQLMSIIAVAALWHQLMKRSKLWGLIATPIAGVAATYICDASAFTLFGNGEFYHTLSPEAQALVWLSVFIYFVLGIFMPKDASTRSRRWSASIPALLAILVLAIIWAPTFSHLLEYRLARLPQESLADRLAYEKPKSPIPETIASSPLSQQVSERLAGFRNRIDRAGAMRYEMLGQIHAANVDEFVIAQGFGFSRMGYEPPIIPAVRPLPDEELELSAEVPEESFVQIDGQTIRVEPRPSPHPIAQSELLSWHDNSQYDFLSVDKSGLPLGNQRAIGFQSHYFNEPQKRFSTSRGEWKLARLELVSLLKFDEPRVYISKKLPQMDQLKSAPTRALNGFESDALAKLWKQEDLVHEESETHLRMLGSLRASEQCQQCHRVAIGDLLGAFSYVLTME